MAGWRLGMAASNPTFINWVLKVKSNIDSGQFKPVMLAAAKALSLGDDWYAEVNKVYAERRKVAEQIMQALGCTFDASQQGLFVWGKIPAEALSAEAVADKVLSDARVRRAIALLTDKDELAASAYDSMAQSAFCVFNPKFSTAAALSASKSLSIGSASANFRLA